MFVVGSSSSKKRKQSYETKQEKKKAKMKETDNNLNLGDTICGKCKLSGHANANSPLCPEHIARKSEVLKYN